ncbi:FIP domain protein [Teladorsagia circumcincta]|uniref:FIP domain protein n=1 Tax=Teladorsagia circumcincta TaxID=45464 RepID=A0A2G9UQJ8_TELCI|nr:FIP domain protein [Teladorsagia circumcincta]
MDALEMEMDFGHVPVEVTMISKKLSEMEEQQLHSNDERGRLRTENAVLTERVHVLEEQLLVAEQRFREQLQDEKNRTRELLQRIEREKQLENESLSLKYQMLEKDLHAARKDAEKARDETAKQLEVVEDLRGQLAESKLLIEDLEDERIKFKEEAQQDIDSSSEMVEVLTQQTEELRRNGAPRQGSIIEQMSGLEESLEQARADIRDLQRERDDLQAQLLAASVERGRSLLADEPSLADELMSGGGDSQQILEALREQEVCNQKLRVYINGILMRVIERHPEILEIGESENPILPAACGQRTKATSTQLTVRRSSRDSASRLHARFIIVIVNVDAVVVGTSDLLSANIVPAVGLT